MLRYSITSNATSHNNNRRRILCQADSLWIRWKSSQAEDDAGSATVNPTASWRTKITKDEDVVKSQRGATVRSSWRERIADLEPSMDRVRHPQGKGPTTTMNDITMSDSDVTKRTTTMKNANNSTAAGPKSLWRDRSQYNSRTTNDTHAPSANHRGGATNPDNNRPMWNRPMWNNVRNETQPLQSQSQSQSVLQPLDPSRFMKDKLQQHTQKQNSSAPGNAIIADFLRGRRGDANDVSSPPSPSLSSLRSNNQNNNNRASTTLSSLSSSFLSSRPAAQPRQQEQQQKQQQQQNTNNNNNDSGTTSWRTRLSDTTTAPIRDMTDVSQLRAAFLHSTKRSKVQATQYQQRQQQQASPLMRNQLDPNQDESAAAWRQKPGARDFRKRIQQQEYAQKQQERQKYHEEKFERYRNRFAPVDSSRFFANKEELDALNVKAAAQAAAREDKERRHGQHGQRGQTQRSNQGPADEKKVTLPPIPTSVRDLSLVFRVKTSVILRKLEALGERPTGDEDFKIDVDTMELVAMDLGLEPERSTRRLNKSVTEERADLLLQRRTIDEEEEGMVLLPPRPPVVCIMGHVDHGKTTLMDSLRRKSRNLSSSSGEKKKKKSKNKSVGDDKKNAGGDVAGTEAGGITQVISAFQVPLDNQDSAVTFLDTPGHAAFRAMRESGSHAADVIVLVVAADDGVSPQTVEIINFYKSIVTEGGGGGISLVVAMTKVDKPGIIVDESKYRIESQLMEHGIITESFAGTMESEYGPPVQLVPVSGLTGEGLEDLIDALVLQSEVMELRADPKASAEGIVLDAKIEKGVGVVVDCIVRWGSLERGDIILSGVHRGKVKALKDVHGGMVKLAAPSQPVRIIGFKSLPKAGDPLTCVESEEMADQLVERRMATGGADQNNRTEDEGPTKLEVMGVAAQHRNLEKIHTKYDIDMNASATTLRIPVIVKADADGTLAALRESLVGMGEASSLDVVIDPISQGIGPVNTNDVALAKDSNAPIFSFNVKQTDKEVMQLLESEEVTFKTHKVIYSLLDDAKEIFSNYLPSTRVEQVHGKAVVKAVFSINNSANRENIAGLRVSEGSIFKDKSPSGVRVNYRVLRNGELVSTEGECVTASSLKRVKEDVDEVKFGSECGLGLEGFNKYEEGDVIECYSVEETKMYL